MNPLEAKFYCTDPMSWPDAVIFAFFVIGVVGLGATLLGFFHSYRLTRGRR